jgi:hypothetical protein
VILKLSAGSIVTASKYDLCPEYRKGRDGILTIKTLYLMKRKWILTNKLHSYLKITGILNNVFRPQKTLKKTRITLYNTLALPVLLYGSETWTIKARDARRITAAEIKYMRRRAGYIWTD